MSGAEVAGLVLGVVPLLISGLEHYGEGVRTIRKMKNSSTEFLKLKQTLQVQNQIFLNCLEQLLKNDVDERKLAGMLANVADIAWSEPEIDRCLRQRLGRSYSAYFGAVKAMSGTMNEFREALQLSPDGKGPFSVDKRSVSDALKRIRSGLKMRAYVELMDEITSQNQALCQLTHQSSSLEPIRESRRKVPDFEQARNHARSIFGTLQRALLNSCRVSHKASFYMRPLEIASRACSQAEAGRYRVVLHHEAVTATGPALPWSIEEAEIHLLDEGDAQKTGRSVRFQAPPIPSTTQQKNTKEIQDLCRTIQQLRSSHSGCDVCLGYLADVANKCRHSLYWPEKPLVDKTGPSSITLAQVLDANYGHKLGESDKRYLALALASGMLRLHNTPWLDRQWGKKEVLLFKRRGGIVASHPFISADLALAAQLHASARSPAYFTSCRPIKEETLFALGVLLIELAMEKPFEELAAPEDLKSDGTKHDLSDFYTADRLVDEVYLRAGERYGDVVRRCIRCEFDQKKSSLDDPAFRRKVYEGVVAELELDVADLVNL